MKFAHFRYLIKYLALSEVFFYLPLVPVWFFINKWDIEHIVQWYLTAHIYSIPIGIIFRKYIGLLNVKKWLEL